MKTTQLGETALIVSSKLGHIEAVCMLVSAGANVSARDRVSIEVEARRSFQLIIHNPPICV